MLDESTYGFNKQDADELLQLIDRGDIEYEELKPVQTSSTRLFVYTTSTAFSSNTATADITTLAGSSVESDATVNDPLGHFSDVLSGSKGVCVRDGGEYYALGPYVVGLRVNAFTLQLRKENASDSFWATYHTGDDCDEV